MAYEFVRASNQYITANSAPVTVSPCTIAARSQTTNLDHISILVQLSDSSGGNFKILGLNGNNDVVFVEERSTSDTEYNPGGVYVVDTTYSFVGKFTSATSRAVYINTTSSTVGTTNVSPSGIDRLFIGALFGTPNNRMLDGRMSDVAIWSAALNDDEITSLSKGFKAHRIRPQSLVFYAPLIRDLNDIKAGLALTNNNAATVAAHPRVY